jgi:flagellar biosynthetic protein FlhB
VPIVENPPLARSLYRTVEVGSAIPIDLYAAVAAILAYLYRQRVEAEMRERRARQNGSANATPQARPVVLQAQETLNSDSHKATPFDRGTR